MTPPMRLGGRTIPDDADQHLSIDELSSAISKFSRAEMARLEKVARLYSRAGLEWRDLRNEAVARSLEGTRKCPRNVNPVTFLANAMKSIVSIEYSAAALRPQTVSLSATGTDGEALDVRSSELNVEENILANDELAGRLASIEALFCKDEDAQMLLLALNDGLAGQAACDALNWDKKKLATVQRRVRRTIDAATRKGEGA